MSAAVRRRNTKDGVPLNGVAFIIEGSGGAKGLRITITYRQVSDGSRIRDQVVFERCPADGYAALALAKDLASLIDCDTVFVIGRELPTKPRSRSSGPRWR